MFPKIGVPQNGWFIMENPIKMDDLGVPLFSETSIYRPFIFLVVGRYLKMMSSTKRLDMVNNESPFRCRFVKNRVKTNTKHQSI